MGAWTVRHRILWFVEHVRRGGLPELRRRVERYTSPKARAAARRRRADGINFDAAHAYRTNEVLTLEDLTITGERTGSRHYEPTPAYDIESALRLLDIPPEEATFVDIGCGMGRPLLVAADMPFKRIIGVEFARELLDIAAENVARRAALRGPDDRIELICSDASLLAIPDGPVAFFFFNSFGSPTLDRLLANIHASWRESPRPIRFIYVNVQHPEIVAAEGFRARTVAPDYHFTIFEPA